MMQALSRAGRQVVLLALPVMACATQPSLQVPAEVAATAPAAPVVTGRIESRSYFYAEAGADMPYELYVPTTYRPDRPMPLVIVLHGLGSSPERVIRYQGLTDLAEERGYVLAAPVG
jgi:poly(3-hydroxybutyrate) depolymerase